MAFSQETSGAKQNFSLADVYYRAVLAFWSTSGAALKCAGPKEAHVTGVTEAATPATLQKAREDLHKLAFC